MPAAPDPMPPVRRCLCALRTATMRMIAATSQTMAPSALFIAERLDGIQPRGLERGVHAEEQPDRRGKAEAERECPPRQRDRETRRDVHGPPQTGAERDADHAAERGEKRRLHQELK